VSCWSAGYRGMERSPAARPPPRRGAAQMVLRYALTRSALAATPAAAADRGDRIPGNPLSQQLDRSLRDAVSVEANPGRTRFTLVVIEVKYRRRTHTEGQLRLSLPPQTRMEPSWPIRCGLGVDTPPDSLRAAPARRPTSPRSTQPRSSALHVRTNPTSRRLAPVAGEAAAMETTARRTRDDHAHPGGRRHGRTATWTGGSRSPRRSRCRTRQSATEHRARHDRVRRPQTTASSADSCSARSRRSSFASHPSPCSSCADDRTERVNDAAAGRRGAS